MMTPIEIAKKSAEILDNKKGMNIKIIEIKDLSIIADYMVIATGTGTTHVKALADEVEVELKKQGVTPARVEGYRSNSWILIDYSNVIVHVFSNETRDFYDLERLWKDGKEITIQ